MHYCNNLHPEAQRVFNVNDCPEAQRVFKVNDCNNFLMYVAGGSLSDIIATKCLDEQCIAGSFLEITTRNPF